ncbi:MAG TPA: hypothetical protein VKB34_16340, partial [Povalibacter sp.]|nr:hypothetical protein [Povalibacter sp.]
GDFAVSGFDTLSLLAGSMIEVAESGSLSSTGSVTLSGIRVTGAGADYAVTAAGRLQLQGTSQRSERADALGGVLRFAGDSVDIAAPVIAAAGRVEVNATGDITLADSGSIDVAGRDVRIDGVAVPVPGGAIRLTSQHGSVTMASAATMRADASVRGDGGTLSVQAAEGQVSLAGTISAAGAAGARGGSLSVDAARVDFSQLISTTQLGHFTEALAVRQRGIGDLAVASGQTITARQVSLAADQGGIAIDGVIDASSPGASSVVIAARDTVRLRGQILAVSGDTQERSRVDLYSTTGVALEAASVIDVSGEQAGAINLRLPRTAIATVVDGDASNDALRLAGNLRGAGSIVVEGVQRYELADIDSSAVAAVMGNPLFDDATAFSATAGDVATALRMAGDTRLHVRPGIEIASSGDLTVSADWNLYDWRFLSASGVAAAEPGVLTLRAAGDLRIDRSISDGFRTVDGLDPDAYLLPTTPGESWSYRLVAGADLDGADPLGLRTPATAVAHGDILLAPGTPNDGFSLPDQRMIRTGTGDITLAATGDLVLGNQASVIYTAGVRGTGVLFPLPVFEGGLGNLPYPERAGSVRVNVGGDVVGAPTTQLYGDWLWRIGCQQADCDDLSRSATAWTVSYDHFEQGIAAFGGGSVSVNAGGSIHDLWASAPSIGRQVGGTRVVDNRVEVTGGGNVSLRSGADILGGGIYAGLGRAELQAGGRVGQSTSGMGLAPIVALGDATAEVSGRGDVAIAGTINP